MPFSWTPPFSPRLQRFDLSELGEQQKQWLHEKSFLFIQTARTLKEWQWQECWCLKAAFRAVRKTTQLCRKSRKGCLNILSDAEEYVAIIIIWCKNNKKNNCICLLFSTLFFIGLPWMNCARGTVHSDYTNVLDKQTEPTVCVILDQWQGNYCTFQRLWANPTISPCMA